jgi:hypothetical protein
MLREYAGRLVCDACTGLMVTDGDLIAAIKDLTGYDPVLEPSGSKPGTRACPRCPQVMAVCRLRVVVEDKEIEPRPELDRCAAHGIWFDKDELAKVLQKVRGAASGGAAGGSPAPIRGGFSNSAGGWWPGA